MTLRKRNYVVLRQARPGDNIWVQVTAAYARSPRAAIRQAREGADDAFRAGSFIALPARYWKPVTP